MVILSKDRRQHLQLLSAMTVKDVKARYKRALFGFLWVLLNPLLQMLVIGTIFTLIIKTPVNNYFLFLFVGLLLWNFFSLSLSKATPSIVYERALIQKAKFPRDIVPISIVLANFFHLLVSLSIVLAWVAIIGQLSLGRLLIAILSILWLLILTTGAALFTTTLNVRFRDVSFLVQAGLQILFYATPIIYPLSFIPSNLYFVFLINPLTSIVQLSQYAFAGQQLPPPSLIVSNFIISALVVIAGYVVFKNKSPFFDDWV